MTEIYCLHTYAVTQENVSKELLQPFEIQSIRLSNNQSEVVLIEFYPEDDLIPFLDITADTIFLEEVSQHHIRYLLSGVNEIVFNQRLLCNREIRFSTIGTGAGTLAIVVTGNWKKGAPYDMSNELEQISQVNKDQMGQATAGSEYYRTRKSSTAPKQVGINPYNP